MYYNPPLIQRLLRQTHCFYVLTLVVFCTFFGGCSWQPTLKRPTVKLPAYQQANDFIVQQKPALAWWQGYGSEELIQLFNGLPLNNLDIATARTRVTQARALLGQQRANNWPSVNPELNARSRRDLDNSDNQHSSGLNFDVAYLVDIWGRRSAAEFAAELSVTSQHQEYQQQLLQLQTTLAQSYFGILALHERQEIAQQNLNASQALLELVQFRLAAGTASGIELHQQRNTWLTAKVQLIDLNKALVNRKHALATLLGQNLFTPSLHGQFNDLLIPPVKLVQPSALLEYRPDIQLAETQWRITETELFQQQKKRWPALTLSAGFDLDDVLDGGQGWLASFASSLSAPMFDAGRISNQIAAAQAGLTIAELNYQQTVLIAMQDALQTLSQLRDQRQLLSLRKQELDSNLRLYNLAKLKYDSGDSDFTSLLTAQRSWFSAQDNFIQVKTNLLLATVDVFRAMGVAPEINN